MAGGVSGYAGAAGYMRHAREIDPKAFSELVDHPDEQQVNTDFDKYENKVMSLAFYPEHGTKSMNALSYCVEGLCEEAGECAGKVKKARRDDGGVLTPERKEALKKELGDTLWYITALAREAGFSLREIAEGNIEKLFDRAKRGTLGGSGDNR